MLMLLTALFLPSPDTGMESLPGKGQEIPSFYVRRVAGNRPNLATCLVCQYGDRPVVLVAAREFDDQVSDLIVQLDEKVDQNRGIGLRGFAVFLTAEPRLIQPRLMTARRAHRLHIPLAVPVQNRTGPVQLELARTASLTVILYRNKRILQRYDFRTGTLTPAKLKILLREVDRLIDDE